MSESKEQKEDPIDQLLSRLYGENSIMSTFTCNICNNKMLKIYQFKDPSYSEYHELCCKEDFENEKRKGNV